MKCKQCGQEFEVECPKLYVYKIDRLLFCLYKCRNEYSKTHKFLRRNSLKMK